MADITIERTTIFDESANTYYSLPEDNKWEEVIKFYVGKPARGDIFNIVKEIVPGTMGMMKLAGSDGLTTEVFRPDNRNIIREVKETWQWTGYQWKTPITPKG